MQNPWLWLAVLAAIAVVLRLPRILIALSLGDRIAARALQKVPDEIHLDPSAAAWTDNPAWTQSLEALRQLGFGDAGAFTVREMPGIVVRLLANEADAFYGAMYEHPVAGRWTEFTSFFADGTFASFSTLRPTGLNAPPGCVRVHAPGARPEVLYARALRERPKSTPRYATVATARQDFERNYAEMTAWRKKAGISRSEVVNVAARKVA